MDTGLQHWLEKLENKVDTLSNVMLEKVTELSTLVGVYLPKQDAHENRLNKLEDEVAEIKSDNTNRARNHNVLLGVGTIAATILAVIIGILVDRYLMGGGG